MAIPRRSLTPRDVKIDILYCGICHSDLHYARNEWRDVIPTIYPCVPGHEIIGRVAEVGPCRFGSGSPGDARFLRHTPDRRGRRDVGVQQINEAYERMLTSDVKYRFTIDMATLQG